MNWSKIYTYSPKNEIIWRWKCLWIIITLLRMCIFHFAYRTLILCITHHNKTYHVDIVNIYISIDMSLQTVGRIGTSPKLYRKLICVYHEVMQNFYMQFLNHFRWKWKISVNNRHTITHLTLAYVTFTYRKCITLLLLSWHNPLVLHKMYSYDVMYNVNPSADMKIHNTCHMSVCCITWYYNITVLVAKFACNMIYVTWANVTFRHNKWITKS